MLFRAHEVVGDFCKWCGARKPGPESTCIAGPAEVPVRPEPQRRQLACEDAETIGARITEIRLEARPMCPLTPARTLYECLRSSAECGATCPHRGDWIGPQPA